MGATAFSRPAFAAGTSPPVTAVAFSHDGETIFRGSQSGLEWVSAKSGDVVHLQDVDFDNIHSISRVGQSNHIAIAGGTPGEFGGVALLDTKTRQVVHRTEFGSDVVYDLCVTTDGKRLVAAGGDEVCSVFLVKSKQPALRYTKHSRAVTASVWLADNSTIVSAGRDQTLRVWDADNGDTKRTLHHHSRDVTTLANRPTTDGLPMIASASKDRSVRFWQPTIGRMVRFARLPATPLCIAWVQQGEMLVAGCSDGSARLIDPTTVNLVKTIEVSEGWLYAVDVDPTEPNRVVFGTTNGQSPIIEL